MKLPTECRYCHKPLEIEVDDAYAGLASAEGVGPLGDPMRLIKLASCSECAALRVERRELEEQIAQCANLLFCLDDRDSRQREQLSKILGLLTDAYQNLITKWLNVEALHWESDPKQAIVRNPRESEKVLKQLWQESKPGPAPTPQTSLPYKDE